VNERRRAGKDRRHITRGGRRASDPKEPKRRLPPQADEPSRAEMVVQSAKHS